MCIYLIYLHIYLLYVFICYIFILSFTFLKPKVDNSGYQLYIFITSTLFHQEYIFYSRKKRTKMPLHKNVPAHLFKRNKGRN